ncbi:hypothetical protein BCW_4561 [Bacillus cereus W]|nr:hypothetical protein BAMEG_4933 [Bacillus anthracis str. CDC 684]ACQ46395.1 hypothetical protein BAA_4912 [Bacillus anthracis str. A0248]EDR20143.1 hypothetical protein BAC_4890 [Bacillus anthracis str. A0488]EDR89170.1 hypothetical protein BAQ_4920 [Bacillus anthracis str. A0193]EDR93368.1 hypothetical protein BAH_4945 [Bacillus anthracis str. A0442]EDS98551.1 hypothetical protein BAK_4974 [Bacillus anthracis str. A0389]EDT21142.1 hypothetical protein BAM_4953 [Bacillus anthracis str. A04
MITIVRIESMQKSLLVISLFLSVPFMKWKALCIKREFPYI